MPTLDLIVGACLIAIVAVGIRAGARTILPVAGFAAGALLGALLAPLASDGDEDASFELVLALPAALLAGGVVAAIVERRTVLLRRRLARLDRLRAIDAAGGGALAGASGLVAAWLVGAAIGPVASVRDRIDDSTIVGGLHALVEPPGRADERLPAVLDLFPIVAGYDGPLIRPPVLDVVRDPDVRRADRSVVRIAVSGCAGRGAGSGWVAADGVVVTNAHVVNTADAITVKLGGRGPAHAATPIWFDPINDVALLRVPALAGVRPLTLVRRPREGTAGATIGFPLGRHAITAARIGRTSADLGGQIRNAPNERGFRRGLRGRLTTPFSGRSRPGNSGGPVVDTRGRVLTTVWGGRSDGISGAGVPNRFVSSALRRAGPAVATGKCRVSPSDRIG